MLAISTLAVLAMGAAASPDCDTFKDCSSCTSASSWTGNSCRWCPKTSDCHAEGSIYNKCGASGSATNPEECGAGVTQVHTAFAGADANGDPSGVVVSWATPSATNTSECLFGTDEKSLDQTATGIQKSYLEGAKVHHHVELANLQPGTTYYYKCGDAATGYSAVLSTVLKHPGTAGFKVSVFGDWGFGKNGHAVSTRRALDQLHPDVDFIWHLGDIGYADDAFLHDPASFQYENVYDGYLEWISNMTSAKPYMVAVGNHESECHSPACLAETHKREGLSNFSAYNARFQMPFAASNGTSNMWYSFNHGLAHFVTIDTETDFPDAPEADKGDSGVIPAGHFGADGEYLAWLEADLARADANRATRPWIFAGGHRPLYSGGTNGALQKAVEELFKKYKVDVYFSGHEHSYTRCLPTYQGQVASQGYDSPNATAYVVVGGAGCDEMKTDGDATVDAGDSPWVVTHDAHYGTGILEVANASAIKWSYIMSDDLSVKDEFWLTK